MNERLPDKPSAQTRYPRQGFASRVLYVGAQRVTLWAARLLYRLKRIGRERIPTHGPLVVVSNHQSYFDPPIVSHMFMRRAIHFFARDSLFDIPLLGPLIRQLQAFPVKRGEADSKAIREALRRLELGAAVLLFPEGTRSEDGEVQELKRGALLLLRKARCPVLPVALAGTGEAFPRTRTFPRLGGVRLACVVGEPIAHEDLFRDGDDAALTRLRNEIIALKEQAEQARAR